MGSSRQGREVHARGDCLATADGTDRRSHPPPLALERREKNEFFFFSIFFLFLLLVPPVPWPWRQLL